ncbi:glycosyltransferase family 61 protein [Pseudooceanicola sp.]|uniref:glycosyltransferase family 61 protein n=1 Tax=Pseudooceanicola sp. TaxID=1914328 RepID=UPI0026269E42|nr:glycosyltransferase family 61 protein [Pseudooceanicola sp.]MDF1854370.1 glycosyltransferase family 61 protein [Pseudooceanicola sp.]
MSKAAVQPALDPAADPAAGGPVLDPSDPAGKPLSSGGWSEALIQLDNAYVVPPLESAFVQPAGVLHADGRYCPEGALWRKWRPLTTKPEKPGGALIKLKGKWIWGGVLWQHFGHFLAESTTRLWALDQIDDADGILFIPKRPAVGEHLAGFQQGFVDQMGCDLPIQVVTQPVRVEHLLVPGQGFGLGEIIRGTDAYRDAVHARFATNIAAEGGEKLYISRSELGVGRGGLIGETRLETYLAAEGYEIFHPQKHSLDVQVARYKAATHVIGAEGSALHMFAMVARPHQHVAVVLRRKSSASNFIEQHLASFGGREPLAVQALRRIWMPDGTKAKRMGLGELDFPQVERDLTAGGFVSGKAGWADMSDDEVVALMGKRAEKMTAVDTRKRRQRRALRAESVGDSAS